LLAHLATIPAGYHRSRFGPALPPRCCPGVARRGPTGAEFVPGPFALVLRSWGAQHARRPTVHGEVLRPGRATFSTASDRNGRGTHPLAESLRPVCRSSGRVEAVLEALYARHCLRGGGTPSMAYPPLGLGTMRSSAGSGTTRP